MNRQATDTGTQSPQTMCALAGGIIMSALIFAGPLWLTGCGRLKCAFANELRTGELIYARTTFIVFDQTASLSKLGKAAKAMKPGPPAGASGDNEFTRIIKDIVKIDVIDKLQPGDYVECYQIGSDPNSYDASSYRVFNGEGAPQVRANIANGAITEKQINGTCPSEIKARKELESQWDSFKTAKDTWLKRLEAARPPNDNCCSAYLATLEDIGKRLQKQPGKKWLVVVGDLLDEPSLTRLKQASNTANALIPSPSPPEPAENERDAFSKVEVILLRPSGAQPTVLRNKLEEYWTSYFTTRGNDQIKFALNGTPSPLELQQNRVPQPNQAAEK